MVLNRVHGTLVESVDLMGWVYENSLGGVG
jgi:hypothetical protein